MDPESEIPKTETQPREFNDTGEEFEPLPKNRETVFAKWVLLAAAIVFGGLYFYESYEPVIRHPPGILVFDGPQQQEMTGRSWTIPGGYRVETLASFSMRGLVLHTMRYTDDRATDFAPMDFVLGWGPMSDQSVLDKLSFEQRMRAYAWSQLDAKNPVPNGEITARSANMHMIPGDDGIKAQLLSVKPGQIISLEGELVEVSGPNSFYWKSAVGRDGGSQLVWVRQLKVEQ